MAKVPIALLALTLPVAAQAADYLGTLKAPKTTLAPVGMYSFATEPTVTRFGGDSGLRVKLGYRYSRYFSIEGEVAEFNRPADQFSRPTHLASAFRSTGFGVDTVATLPLWGVSFYGRMGAYHGDARGGYGWNLTPFAESPFSRTTRIRYGLGLRYAFTKSLGVRAELERHSPLHSQLLTDVDSGDQVSVGVSWRF